MSDPEIARRCHQCGASVRSGALFCPQCGRPMDHQPAADDVDHSATIPLIPQSNAALELAETLAIDQSLTQPLLSEASPAKKEKSKKGPAKGRPDEGAPAGAESQTNVEPYDGVASGVKSQLRVSLDEGARTVGEPQAMGRVEKLRKVSSEVLDQAAYDPSMRFLLVAAVLFLLFLILLVLSKLLG